MFLCTTMLKNGNVLNSLKILLLKMLCLGMFFVLVLGDAVT